MIGEYFYLFGALVFLGIWLLFYWRRKDLRRQMRVMGVLTAPEDSF